MKITLAQERALARLKDVPLCVEAGDEGPHYFFADGSGIHPRTVKSLLDKQLIKPVGDGLFEMTQTYEAA